MLKRICVITQRKGLWVSVVWRGTLMDSHVRASVCMTVNVVMRCCDSSNMFFFSFSKSFRVTLPWILQFKVIILPQVLLLKKTISSIFRLLEIYAGKAKDVSPTNFFLIIDRNLPQKWMKKCFLKKKKSNILKKTFGLIYKLTAQSCISGFSYISCLSHILIWSYYYVTHLFMENYSQDIAAYANIMYEGL